MSATRASGEVASIRPIRLVAVGLIVVIVMLLITGGLGRWPAAQVVNLTTIRAQASASVTITVGNVFAFTPDYFEVNPGDTVTVTVIQIGSLAHTFTLSNVANYSFNPQVNTTTQLVAFFAAHPALVNLNVSGVTGSQVSQSFVAPSKGTYAFVCLQSGHFQSGMNGVMGSGVPVGPPSMPNTGPGAPVFIIGGTIVGLVVLAIVMGFVVGRRKGSVHEMPPERLGYSEPAEPSPTQPT